MDYQQSTASNNNNNNNNLYTSSVSLPLLHDIEGVVNNNNSN